MPRRPLATAAAIIALTLFSAGCATTSNEPPAEPVDTVSGYYAGNWYGPNPGKPLGGLWCTVTPAGEDTWDAKFVATFGETGEYNVSLEGRREGDKVVFGGVEDLGESEGGAFDWSGRIEGDLFSGEYAASTYTGTFKMYRTDPPAE